MILHIELDIGNAAFEHNGEEVARIIRKVADRVEPEADLSSTSFFLWDANGNGAGALWVEDEAADHE